MAEKVSIIIPAYNVKNHLGECLESIVAQDYRNLEVIIVDDGSTDGTLAVCGRYHMADHRIKYISQEHAGMGSAINLGLQLASGSLISIVYADDILDSQFLTRLTQLLDHDDSQVAVANFTELDQQQGAVIYHSTESGDSSLAGTYPISDWFKLANMPVDWLNRIFHCSWGKLFRKQVFKDVLYPKNDFPDNNTVWKLYCNANRISYTPDQLYCHRVNKPESHKKVDLDLKGLESELTILDMLGIDTSAVENIYLQRLNYVRQHALEVDNLFAYHDAVNKLNIIQRLAGGQDDE